MQLAQTMAAASTKIKLLPGGIHSLHAGRGINPSLRPFAISTHFLSTSTARLKKKKPNIDNQISTDMVNDAFDHSLLRKKQRGDSKVLKSIRIPKHTDSKIKQKLNESQTQFDTLAVIIEHLDSITHPSIFGKAMTKCKKQKGWYQAQRIMELALKSNIQLSTVLFNISFDIMAHSDSPERIIEYFDLMIHKYHLQPDIVTFTTLIKSCRKQAKHRYELAFKFWNSMSEFNVSPNLLIYNEMICVCSRAKQFDAAIALFDEFLQNNQHAITADHRTIFCSYLSVFSRNGNINGIKKAIKLFKQYGFEYQMDPIIITDIMRCYNIASARRPVKALKVYSKFIDNGGVPDLFMMHLKCKAICNILKDDIVENEYSFEQKHAFYKEIEDTIYRQLQSYNIKMTQILVGTQLSAAIFLYRQTEPMKAVEIVKDLSAKKLISFKFYDEETKQIMIDLHSFDPMETQFILLYVIAFEVHQLLVKRDSLVIIVGVGKHSHEDTSGQMKQFVVEQLQKYEPAIKCRDHPTNAGRIVIEKKNLLPYLNDKCMNYAKRKLTNATSDWYHPGLDKTAQTE